MVDATVVSSAAQSVSCSVAKTAYCWVERLVCLMAAHSGAWMACYSAVSLAAAKADQTEYRLALRSALLKAVTLANYSAAVLASQSAVRWAARTDAYLAETLVGGKAARLDEKKADW